MTSFPALPLRTLVFAIALASLPFASFAAPACVNVWAQKSEASWRLNDIDLYRDLTLSDSLIMRRQGLHHVLHGDYDENIVMENGQRKSRVTLRGGMHTQASINFFLNLRPDLDQLMLKSPGYHQKFRNGVHIYYLPESAYTRPDQLMRLRVIDGQRVFTGVKTTFPAHWSDEKIKLAIAEVAKTGMIERRGMDANKYLTRKVGMYSGVRIVVDILLGQQPTVTSAYPSDDQGGY